MGAVTAAAEGTDTILAALRRLGDGPAADSIQIGELLAGLNARAQSLALLLLAAPNLKPGPSIPGFSTIFAVPLCIVAFEMVLGRPHLRLPAFIARRRVTRGRVAAFVERLAPLLIRFERVLRPRVHHYAPERAAFRDFRPFYEIVAGPAHAGTFGPAALDPTFGPEVRFLGIPPGMKPNRPPSEGLQFFGLLAVEGRTGSLQVELRNREGTVLHRLELEGVRS